MEASRLHPDLRPSIRSFRRAPVDSGVMRGLIGVAMRMMPTRALSDVVTKERIAFRRGVGVRVYTPKRGGNGSALLWIHGGGLVIGASAMDDARCARVADDLGVVVVSVEYRLAPRHPFPAPLDDCFEAWQWLLRVAAERGVDLGRIAVGGQSAGGGLAAALVQRIHDGGGTQPVAQWLFCPMLDDRTAAQVELDDVQHLVWDNAANRVGWSAYLGGAPGAETVPEYAAAARRKDLSGLPPAWIGTGDIELFYPEDVGYATALEGAGVPCTLDVVPGAPHGFETLADDTPLATAYLARAHAWLGVQLGAED